jgi:hypothetical protein
VDDRAAVSMNDDTAFDDSVERMRRGALDDDVYAR